MPIYGEAKQRDMIRSILPSSRRKSAREELAAIKRRSRHILNESLNNFRGYAEDAIELWEFGDDDLDAYPDGEIHYAVRDRQLGDNTAAIERWAVAITADLPKGDRMNHFRALMPDTTVGRHACQHVENLTEMDDGVILWGWWYNRLSSRRDWTDVEIRWADNAEMAVLVFRMHKLLETNGALKKFNKSDVAYERFRKVIPHRKYAADYGIDPWRVMYNQKDNEWWFWAQRRRPLRGVHDVISFLHGFSDNSYYGNKWRSLEEVLNELGV